METMTTIDKLVEIYQNYNNSSLDINHLVCSKCNKWLTSPIYLVDEHQNICDNCRKTHNVSGVNNKCLEQLLNKTKYPCKYFAIGCYVFDENIAEHEKICELNIKCSECDEHFAGKENLMQHLKDHHSMEKLIMVKPTIDILVKNINQNAELYHLVATNNSLVLRLQVHVATNQIYLLFCNATDLCAEWSVTVVLVTGGSEFRQKGQVFNSVRELSTLSVEDYTKMFVPNMAQITGDIRLKVYFANYENVEPYIDSMDTIMKELECPICLETMNGTFNQCPNGHNMCTNCKPMVVTCPICRQAISSTNIRINNIFTHLLRPCANANFGCFVYKQGNALDVHERTCPWKKIECVICKFKCNKATIVEHMMLQHAMQKCNGFWMDVVPGYVSYNGRIFKFDIQVDIKAKIVKWYLCLLHDTAEEAHQYEYNLRMKIDDVTLRASCMSQLNESYSKMTCTFASAVSKSSFTILIVGNGIKVDAIPEIEQACDPSTTVDAATLNSYLKQPTFIFRADPPVATPIPGTLPEVLVQQPVVRPTHTFGSFVVKKTTSVGRPF